MATGTKRKRRVGGQCPNPLFIKWMEEWRDEAREKGVQSQYAYTKALNSLKKYPLPLSSGQEAKILDHIGEKLAKMLDKKLAEHRAKEAAASSPGAAGSSTSPLSASPPPPPPPKQQKKSRVGSKRKERPDTTSSSPPGSSSRASSSDKATPKAKRKSTGREYVPVYRSGPYAVLIALYNAEQKPSWHGYLKKSELISEAQPHCDTSFTVPDDGSYYTAWSSVSQIEKKGLIRRVSHPPKFSLTDSGVSLALRLLQGNLATSKPSSSSSSHSSPPSSNDQRPTRVGRKKSSSRSATSTRGPTKTKDYHVVSPPSSPTSDLTDTYSIDNDDVIECSDDPFPHFQATPPYTTSHKTPPMTTPPSSSTRPLQKKSSTVEFISLSDSSDSDVEIVPLAQRISKRVKKSPTIMPTMPVTSTSSDGKTKSTSGSSGKEQETKTLSDGGNKALTPSQMAGLAAIKRLERQKEAMQATEPTQPIVFDLTDAEDLPSSHTQEKTTTSKLSSKPRTKASTASKHATTSKSSSGKTSTKRNTMSLESRDEQPNGTSKLSSRSSHSSSSAETVPTKSPPAVTSSASSASMVNVLSAKTSQPKEPTTTEGAVDLSSPEFILKPGDFDVVLCVDNSESSASRNSRVQFRGVLLSELGKNGVQFDVRKLHVGDFTWIAREKVQPIPGCLVLPKSREAVLEYIVERKRMDDLAGSIMDGRFNEQKFRLSQCGVAHPIYLVEEYGDSTHLKLPERSLNQAIANTQVVSGFFIKRTRDIRESVAYLTIMTRALQRKYAGKTVKAFARDTIMALNETDLKQNPSTTILSMPFNQFNEASVKNRTLSVYEMFGRHLVQLPGFSVDKAAAVLDKYPTVSHLRDAYQKCENNTEREKMLLDIRAGPTKRRLGPQLSSLIYSLYWKGQ